MTIHHHIASSGLFLLLTCLVLSTLAIQVETLPPVPCHEFRPAADVLVETSRSYDNIGCPDEGGAYTSVTTTCYCELDVLRTHCYRENARAAIVPCTSARPNTPPKSGEASFKLAHGLSCNGTDTPTEREQSSYGIFECGNNANTVLCPLVHPKVGDCCSPSCVCNEIGRKYNNEKECFCSDGQFHCTFNESAVPAYPATQQGSASIVNQHNLTEAKEDDDAVPPRPVLSEVRRHAQRRGKRDKGEKRRKAKKNGGVMRSSNSRKLLPDVGWRGSVSSKAVADEINVSCVLSYAQSVRNQGTLT